MILEHNIQIELITSLHSPGLLREVVYNRIPKQNSLSLI